MMDVSTKTQEQRIERKRKRSPASELKMVDFRRKVPDYELNQWLIPSTRGFVVSTNRTGRNRPFRVIASSAMNDCEAAPS